MHDPTLITVYPAGVKIRVSPDDQPEAYPDHLPPPMKIGICEYVETPPGSGNYRLEVRKLPVFVRLTADISDELGLGTSYRSLRRLMTAGFVRGRQITPGQYAMHLQSFFQHCERVAADPEFWTGANLKRYMAAV